MTAARELPIPKTPDPSSMSDEELSQFIASVNVSLRELRAFRRPFIDERHRRELRRSAKSMLQQLTPAERAALRDTITED